MSSLSFRALDEIIHRFKKANGGDTPLVAFVNKAFVDLWHEEIEQNSAILKNVGCLMIQ